MSIKKALEPKVEAFEKEDGIMSLVTAMLPKDEFWTLLKKAGFPEIGETQSWTIRDDGKNIVIKSSAMSPKPISEEFDEPDLEADC